MASGRRWQQLHIEPGILRRERRRRRAILWAILNGEPLWAMQLIALQMPHAFDRAMRRAHARNPPAT